MLHVSKTQFMFSNIHVGIVTNIHVFKDANIR